MSVDLDKKAYKKRIIDDVIDRYLKVSGAICIEGMKWCGKTWTSKYHANSEFLVNDSNGNFSNRKLASLNPSFVLQGETPRLIDEWQEVPSLWDATRVEIDKRHKKGQIILTGSSTPVKNGYYHSGAGRIVKIRMNTMSLYESGDSLGLVSLKDLCMNNVFKDQFVEELPIDKLATLIIRGGWPENIDVDSNDVHLMPRAYVDTLINKDLNDSDEDENEENVNFNKAKFELLLKSLARNESTTVSNLTLLKDIQQIDEESISRNTLSNYLNILNSLFILNNQPPFSPNIRSSLRIKQSEKRHFSDPAIACALLNLTPQKLINDINLFGFLFEALVERDLGIYALGMNAKLFHYQDYKDNEIDAILELEDGDYCAIEIKLGANKIEEASKNLNKVSEEIIKSGGKGPKLKLIIVGLGNACFKYSDNTYVVPINALKN